MRVRGLYLPAIVSLLALHFHWRALAGDPSWQGANSRPAATQSERLGRLAEFSRLRGDFHRVVDLRTALVESVDPHALTSGKHHLGLAVARALVGDLLGSLDVFRRARQLWPEEWGGDRSENLSRRLNYLAVQFSERSCLRVLQSQEELHDECVERLPPDDRLLLMAKSNLAVMHKRVGNHSRALDLEQQVLEGLSSRLPRSHPYTLKAATELVGTARALNYDAWVRRLSFELIDALTEYAESLHSKSPREARMFAASEIRRFGHLFDWAGCQEGPARGEYDRNLYEWVAALRSAAVRPACLDATTGGSRERDRIRACVEGMDRRLRRPQSSRTGIDSETREAALDMLLLEGNDSGRKRLWSERLPSEAAVGLPSVQGLADALDEDAIWVSFLRAALCPQGPTKGGEPCRGRDSLLAFVVTPKGQLEIVELGSADDLEQLVERWRHAIGYPVPGSDLEDFTAPTHEVLNELELTLAQRILLPCLSVADGRPNTLHIVADDFLHELDFEALRLASGKLVRDAYDVRCELSTLDFVRAKRVLPARGTFLAVGGVDYGSLANARAAKHFAPLKNSQRDLECVKRLCEEHSECGVEILSGREASKEAFLRYAEHADYLLLSTHGWCDSESLQNQDDLSPSQRSLLGAAPGLACRLVFAGVHQAPIAASLTAEELACLDLSRCRLAFLATCDSDVGLYRPVQGVESLRAALHRAGVRTTITTRWAVSDRSASRLVGFFFEAFIADGLPAGRALREAKRRLQREEGSPTARWAAWRLSGDAELTFASEPRPLRASEE